MSPEVSAALSLLVPLDPHPARPSAAMAETLASVPVTKVLLEIPLGMVHPFCSCAVIGALWAMFWEGCH